MIETLALPQEYWGLLEAVVRGTFRDEMPTDPRQSTFRASFDGKRLAGFVHIESLYHVNLIYAAPEYRHTGLVWKMMEDVDRILTGTGHSGIVLTDEPGVARYLKKLGATDRGVWRYLRKDY